MGSTKRTSRGRTVVEQQEQDPREVDRTRPEPHVISGPGAADFVTAPGGEDRPETGGTAQTRGGGPLEGEDLEPRTAPETTANPGERDHEDEMTGSRTGMTGGGGAEGHNPSPVIDVRRDAKGRER